MAKEIFKGDYYIKRLGNLLLVQKMYVSKQKQLLASVAPGDDGCVQVHQRCSDPSPPLGLINQCVIMIAASDP